MTVTSATDSGTPTATTAPAVPRLALVATLLGAVVVAQASVAVHGYEPFLSPIVGFLAVVGVPLFFMHHLLRRWWTWRDGGEQVVVALALTLLALMLAGLVTSTLLPYVGVARPLDTWPVVITTDVLVLALGVAAWPSVPTRVTLRLTPTTGRGQALAVAAVVVVALAAAGATRLNNGAGPQLTIAALILASLTLVALFISRDRVDAGVIPFVLFGVALGLLFMTSLRGWFTTGHDVQHEMLDFLTTSRRGRWSPSVHDGYNSCLSITVLPTLLLRWTRVFDPYVFKVFFQVLYAACPVLVYYIARRFTGAGVSIVSAIYFVGFVGFQQDMPMLNRQEIAYLFFAAAVLVLLMHEHSARARQVMFCVLAVGVVAAHYSTSYFAAGTLIVALLARPFIQRVLPRVLRRLKDEQPRRSASALGWAPALALVALITVWQVPVNHSGGQVTTVVSDAIRGALHGSDNRDPVTGYALGSHAHVVTQSEAFHAYLGEQQALAARHPAAYVAAPAPSASLTPLIPQGRLPATDVGRALTGSAQHTNVVNRAWRTLAAFGLQIFLAIGLLLALLTRRHRRGLDSDAVSLGVGLVLLIAAQVVLPALSLDYGVGRSFMQALIVVGPLIAIGSRWLAVGPLRRWADGLMAAVAIVFFVSTSGLAPQVLGGYPPQMHLNNAGDYYDRFYLHPQEVSALHWLTGSVIDASRRYPDVQLDQDLFNRARSLGGIRAYSNIYPSAIHTDAWVVLSYPNVVDGKVEATFNGHELWMRYPTAVLGRAKSLVYDDGATKIYR